MRDLPGGRGLFRAAGAVLPGSAGCCSAAEARTPGVPVSRVNCALGRSAHTRAERDIPRSRGKKGKSREEAGERRGGRPERSRERKREKRKKKKMEK